MIFFSIYLIENQKKHTKSDFEGKMQGASWLVISTWSWHKVWLILLRSVTILANRLSKVD